MPSAMNNCSRHCSRQKLYHNKLPWRSSCITSVVWNEGLSGDSNTSTFSVSAISDDVIGCSAKICDSQHEHWKLNYTYDFCLQKRHRYLLTEKLSVKYLFAQYIISTVKNPEQMLWVTFFLLYIVLLYVSVNYCRVYRYEKVQSYFDALKLGKNKYAQFFNAHF